MPQVDDDDHDEQTTEARDLLSLFGAKLHLSYAPTNYGSTTINPPVHDGFIPKDGPSSSYPVEGLAGVFSQRQFLADAPRNPFRQHAQHEVAIPSIERPSYYDNLRDSDYTDGQADVMGFEETDAEGFVTDTVDEDFSEHDDAGVFARTRSSKTGRRRSSTKPKRQRQKREPRARGFPRGRKKTNKPIEPSAEYKRLYSKATELFISQEYQTAEEYAQMAIAINPEQFGANSLMSMIHDHHGEHLKAIEALLLGAVSRSKDRELWQQIATRYLDLYPGEQIGYEKALACYSIMIKADKRDLDALFGRATMSKNMGSVARAMTDVNILLREAPHNSDYIFLKSELFVSLKNYSDAKKLYHDKIEAYKNGELNEDNDLTFDDINIYAEIFAKQELFQEGISTLKELARLLAGREAETFWNDVIDDDREFDADDTRRLEIQQYQPGCYPIEAYGGDLRLELRIKLGIFRLKQDKRHREEALGHFDWLYPDDTGPDSIFEEYYDLFKDTAEALRRANQWSDALRFYEPLRGAEGSVVLDVRFWTGIASCYFVCNEREEAIECYEKAKEMDDLNTDSRIQLSKLYKLEGKRDLALRNANEALEIGTKLVPETDKRKYEKRDVREARQAAEKVFKAAHKMSVKPTAFRSARRPEATRKYRFDKTRLAESEMQSLAFDLDDAQQAILLSGRSIDATVLDELERDHRANKKQRAAEMRKAIARRPRNDEDADMRRTTNLQHIYQTLLSLTLEMREGEEMATETWLDCAEELITDFRSVRVFYPPNRHTRFTGYDQESVRTNNMKLWQKQSLAEIVAHREIEGRENHLDQPPVEPIPSIESGAPSEYRGISFDEWLDIFLEFAFVKARTGGKTAKSQIQDVMEACTDCNVWYHQQEAMLQIHVCFFACCLALNDLELCIAKPVRWFMRTYQFSTDSYRLFGALNFAWSSPVHRGGKEKDVQYAPYRQSHVQKFVMRQVRTLDSALPDDYGAMSEDGQVPACMREKVGAEPGSERTIVWRDPDTGEFHKPQEMDVVLLVLYAQFLYAGSSFTNALHYFYRAYAIDPKNPVVVMSIALCYIHESLKRQIENRHQYLLQGIAFLEEYADCRLEKVADKDAQVKRRTSMEIEFNKGRVWHMLGLMDLATSVFENVLLDFERHDQADSMDVSGDNEPCGDDDYRMEAAYSLQVAYALSGDTRTARDITEKYLVIE